MINGRLYPADDYTGDDSSIATGNDGVVTITNKSQYGPELPMTGGAGIAQTIILGAATAGAAGVGLARRRRKGGEAR